MVKYGLNNQKPMMHFGCPQRMRVCFQPERRTPSAVPGQITGSVGTSVWHAQCKPTIDSHQNLKTTTNGNETKHAPVNRTHFTHNTPEHVVCPMEPNRDASMKISENFDYDYDRYNTQYRPPTMTVGGHFQHFRDSEELYEPGPFRTEWLVWH